MTTRELLMARTALKALGRRRRTLSDVFVLNAPDHPHSDRATVLVDCATLEHSLESAILTKFVALSKSDIGRLFEGDNPLATFSAKIKLGFALGLYGLQTRTDLDCIRDIRNAFAHATVPITFDTPEVAEACLQLQRLDDETPRNSSPGLLYVSATTRISTDLLTLAILARRTEKITPELP